MTTKVVLALLALVLLLVFGVCGSCLWLLGSKPGIVSKQNYDKIRVGMSLADVETILGPATEITREQVPQVRDYQLPSGTKPVVTGEKFYRWEESPTGKKIVIGMCDDQVCDKDYWEPSL